MEIKVSKESPRMAGEYLSEILKENSDKPVLLLLPGGSALQVLDFVRQEVIGQNIIIGFGDERYTDLPKNLNLDLFEESKFYQKAKEVGCKIIDSRIFLDGGVVKAGKKLDKTFKDWLKNNPSGIIVLLVGFGPDGHTAGIFPLADDPKTFEKLFEKPDVLAVGHTIGKKGWPERFTMTLPFIRLAHYVLLCGTGDEKRGAVKAILSDAGSLSKTPARIYRELKNATLFTDQQVS
jgi:6-phosphogluconolactonase/glucosamine-6-phosphate isomerase/deaminase